MIIGLTGLKGSGKDTVAAYLIKRHGFERRAFADKLKKSVAALFDIPYHEIDKMKNDPTIEIAVGRPDDDLRTVYPMYRTLIFRELLQRFGTESHRDVFGEDFWVDHCLPLGHYYIGKNIAVTDVRFQNEASRIRALDGFIVEVDRPGLDTEDQHRSEAGLPARYIDFTVLNNGTIHDLEENIEIMLDYLANRWSIRERTG